jgi:hypothetical protein
VTTPNRWYGFACMTCRANGDMPATFDVRCRTELPDKVRCPLCGELAGAIGPHRELPRDPNDISAAEWRDKWCTAISVWEKCATELGRVRRELELAASKADPPTVPVPSIPMKAPEGVH